jgi:hypothetical protein
MGPERKIDALLASVSWVSTVNTDGPGERIPVGKDGAAAISGLHPSTLRARMHKLGIVRPETKEPD